MSLMNVGIEGNEEADKLAHEACNLQQCKDTIAEGIEIRENITGRTSMTGRYTCVNICRIKEGKQLEHVQLPSLHVGQDGNNQARPTPQDKMMSAYFKRIICERGPWLKGIVKPRCTYSKGFSNQTSVDNL